MITLDEFLALPTEEVARLVHATGPRVCVFPINGTRRWFMLEYGDREWDDPVEAYIDISGKRHIELYRLFFDHGIDTLLTPVFGTELLTTRGEKYMQQIGADGLARLATHPDFLAFYSECDVRVRFYGNYRAALAKTPYAYLSDIFDQAVEQTRTHTRHRVFFGVFANEATEEAARLSIEYYREHEKIPARKDLVEMYYGEHVAPVNIFIGFDKPSIFDYPLLATGEEDLYFTLAPSPYLSERQLRSMIYDHLYTRRVKEIDYTGMPPDEIQFMRDFYQENQMRAIGTGFLHGGIWYPELT